MPGKPKFRGMRFAGLGMEFAGAVAGLTLLGYWFDGRYGTKPWGFLIGAAIGLIGGMYNMIREALKATHSNTDPTASEKAAENTNSDAELDGPP